MKDTIFDSIFSNALTVDFQIESLNALEIFKKANAKLASSLKATMYFDIEKSILTVQFPNTNTFWDFAVEFTKLQKK